jgi:hypothetical protein
MGRLLTTAWLSICLFAASGAPATMLDLTTAGSSGMINEARYFQFTATGGGSGNIDSFVRYQAANQAVTQGYNTDGAFQFDEKPGAFTHSILKNDVPLVQFGGVAYREFLFDINESGGNQSPLSLDELQIYVSDVGDLDDPDFPFSDSVAKRIYDMDDDLEDSHVELDAALSGPGSGQLDMILLVPDTFFVDDFGTNPNLYLYSLVGAQGGFLDNSSGFEEWAFSTEGGIIPEPSTALLAGLGLLALSGYAARRARPHTRRT